MAGARCELVMLFTKELYETHQYYIERYLMLFTKELYETHQYYIERYCENYDNEL